MTSQLELYNKALAHFGERSLANLSENREPCRALDGVYDAAVLACLEDGDWHFARRTVMQEPDADATTEFGWLYTYSIPAEDWVKLYQISANEFLSFPLNDYVNEGGMIRANITPIYLTYISKHADFGLDLTKWPGYFADFVGADLADRVSFRITQDKELRDRIKKTREQYRKKAASKDAQQGPPIAPPTGTWVRSRRRGSLQNPYNYGLYR